MATLEKNLEGYRQQNEQYLTEKKMAIMDYHNASFPQENQDAWDKLLTEYQELFDAVKYKDANAKLEEVNTGIMAFLQENTTEVAADDTEGNTGNGTSDNGNTGNGSTGNGNTGSGSGNGNTGSGSGNGNTGSGSGNGNTGNGGSTSSTPSAEPTTPVNEPVQSGNGWSDEEYNIMSAIYVAWSDYVYTDEEARAQLAAQLPGRSCTLVYYPPEQIEEGKAFWNSIDTNVYCRTGCSYSEVAGLYFIYGK